VQAFLIVLAFAASSTAADARTQTATTTTSTASGEVFGIEALGELEEEKSREESEEREVEEIVVTGSRTEKKLADAPIATELITREEIVASGADDLAEVLEEHPGIELDRSTSGTAVRMQGLEAEHVLLLIDGERAIGRFRGAIDPTRFSMENIERVEIVKGASSALYGSEALGGVINIITRESKKPLEAEARAAYGSRNTGDFSGAVGGRVGDLSAHVSGGYHRSDAYDLSPDDEATTGAAFDGFNFVIRPIYRLSETIRIKGRAGYTLLEQDAIDKRATGATFDRAQSTETFSASISPEFKFADPSRLRMSLMYSQFRLQISQDQRGDDVEDTYEDDRQRLVQLSTQYDRLLWSRHLVSLGLEGLFEQEEVGFLKTGSADRQRGAAYVQDEWTVLDPPTPLIFVPGIRLDIDSQFGTRATPKFALRFDPTKTVVMRASIGFGFRAPSFEELYLLFENPGSGYLVEGNPDLQAESSTSIHGSIEYSPLDEVTASVAGFYNDIDNLIETQRVPATAPGELNRFRYLNIAAARTAGVESAVGVHFGRRLRIDLAYTFTDTRDLRTLPNRDLSGRARHRGTAAIAFREPTLGAGASLRTSWVGRRRYYDDMGNESSAEPYATLDAQIWEDFGEYFTVFLGVENLLDEGDIAFLPMPPRRFYGGVAARWSAEETAEEVQ
jgi:outer membrane receptor for ferrienterochelin and colicins